LCHHFLLTLILYAKWPYYSLLLLLLPYRDKKTLNNSKSSIIKSGQISDGRSSYLHLKEHMNWIHDSSHSHSQLILPTHKSVFNQPSYNPFLKIKRISNLRDDSKYSFVKEVKWIYNIHQLSNNSNYTHTHWYFQLCIIMLIKENQIYSICEIIKPMITIANYFSCNYIAKLLVYSIP